MVPNLFIWIGLWRIRWQKGHDNFLFLRTFLRLDEVLHLLATVISCIVENRDKWFSRIAPQLLEKLDKSLGIHLVFDEAEAHIAPWGDTTDHVEPKSTYTILYGRRFTALSLGQVTVRDAAYRSLNDFLAFLAT